MVYRMAIRVDGGVAYACTGESLCYWVVMGEIGGDDDAECGDCFGVAGGAGRAGLGQGAGEVEPGRCVSYFAGFAVVSGGSEGRGEDGFAASGFADRNGVDFAD